MSSINSELENDLLVKDRIPKKSFCSLILEDGFSDLVKTQAGRLALAFTVAQLFNILWTLLWLTCCSEDCYFLNPI